MGEFQVSFASPIFNFHALLLKSDREHAFRTCFCFHWFQISALTLKPSLSWIKNMDNTDTSLPLFHFLQTNLPCNSFMFWPQKPQIDLFVWQIKASLVPLFHIPYTVHYNQTLDGLACLYKWAYALLWNCRYPCSFANFKLASPHLQNVHLQDALLSNPHVLRAEPTCSCNHSAYLNSQKEPRF